VRVEWRRDDLPPPAGATADSALLTESIRAQIAEDGPITFARFMERALTDPDHGYYATAATRPSRSGDFVTAPELHPIFGRTLARQVREMRERLGSPAALTLREYGAGSGALASAVLEGLEGSGPGVRYEPVDLAPQLAAIGERLAIAAPSGPFTGVVIANEFLDALPVHRVIVLNGDLREIHVDWRDGAFAEVAGPLTDDRLASWFTDAGITLAENQRAEVNLAMLDWVDALSRELGRGYVIVVDYGAAAGELYGADRAGGTIRAFAGQRVSSDVLSEPGSRDITSSVDFDALERHARARGFDISGRRRTNEFLIASGLDDEYARARDAAANDWDASLNLRGVITRLLDPNALGGYLDSVWAKAAPTDPPLLGLTPNKRP
jgi:SAM-dependent MidA family methyltransferase